MRNRKGPEVFLQQTVASVAYNWYIGLVTEVNAEQGDENLNFLHTKGPAVSFNFPKSEDLCWVPTVRIIRSIDTLTLATTRWQFQITFANTEREGP